MRERLQKILSAAGVSSRRAAEALILASRVSVNGTVVTELGSKADPDVDDIRVDGERVRIAKRRRYVLLNKPRGYVTTRSDPEGRPIVLDLLKGVREYLYPAGRLDYDTEGLLILTNDGALAARLTHPRHGVERVYEALVQGIPSADALARLVSGVPMEGRQTAPARARILKQLPARTGSPSGEAILRIALREGRNRQVRKMCEAVGHPVLRLRRVQIGPIADQHLKVGHYRELTPAEVRALRDATREH